MPWCPVPDRMGFSAFLKAGSPRAAAAAYRLAWTSTSGAWMILPNFATPAGHVRYVVCAAGVSGWGSSKTMVVATKAVTLIRRKGRAGSGLSGGTRALVSVNLTGPVRSSMVGLANPVVALTCAMVTQAAVVCVHPNRLRMHSEVPFPIVPAGYEPTQGENHGKEPPRYC